MPLIFEPPAALLTAQSAGSLGSPSDGNGVAPNGGSQVWIAASPSGASLLWGGCQVWLSFDNTTYTQIGTITSRANQGLLTATLSAPPGANPDTTDTLAVDLSMSGGALPTGSDADAQASRTLCYVDGELIAYGLATPTTGDAYNLTDLYRGLYGTTGALRSSGAAFVLLDDNIFRYNLPTTYAGQTLYFKFASFNSTGGGVQDLSSLTAVSYTPAAGTAPPVAITGRDATVSSSGVITFASTGVSAGSYTYGSFTVDAKGRLTAASNGTTPLVPANNLSDVANVTTARTNLGVTAAGADTTYAYRAKNLSDLANAATTRGNLAAAKSGTNSDITSLTGLTTALAVSQGGSGQSSFTDGQLLIGDSSTNGLDKASLSAGSNISIANGHGTISISASVPAAANPTATAGPTVVNGSATTFMRSDGAPAIQKASSSQFGIVEVDGKTIIASGGVISESPGATDTVTNNLNYSATGVSGVMLAVGASITPLRTGTVLIFISVTGYNNTANEGFKTYLQYGTGTPPAQGAALAGTNVPSGTTLGNYSVGSVTNGLASATGLVAGLTLGTTYWIDCAGLTLEGGGTATFQQVSISAIEL